MELNKHLILRLDDALEYRKGPAVMRWREAASIRSGLTKPYTSTSNRLHVPRLPATPFFDPAQFPFIDALEASASSIRSELRSLLDSESDSFEPCIAFRPGEPVGQWQPLNHSMRWSALHLWRKGSPVNENLRRCPETSGVLTGISLCDLSGFSPNVHFSLLAPRTHVPPHTGDTNARVIAHLPLIVPDRCGVRVGFESRDWRKGEMLFFDDTIEHEVFNDGDEPLALLVFDLWNPLLSEFDKGIIDALAQAAHGFENGKSVAQ